MESTEGYQVSLDVFQGPMDLLLFLIRKKKLDIHDIPMAVITREYLQYLEKKDRINLEHEAEFLLIAALLINIKSQLLLPREAALAEEADPRQILVNRLLDYQNIKAACEILRDKEKGQMQQWQRDFLPPLPLPEEPEFIEVSLFDLAEVFFTLMKRKEREDVKIIKAKEYSMQEKTKEILEYLKQHSFLDFQEYFSRQKYIDEALLSFFCLMNLIKGRLVVAVQDTLFGTIKVWLYQASSR